MVLGSFHYILLINFPIHTNNQDSWQTVRQISSSGSSTVWRKFIFPQTIVVGEHLNVPDYVSLCVCLTLSLSVRPSVCLSVFLSVCMSVYLSVFLSVCLSVFENSFPRCFVTYRIFWKKWTERHGSSSFRPMTTYGSVSSGRELALSYVICNTIFFLKNCFDKTGRANMVFSTVYEIFFYLD